VWLMVGGVQVPSIVYRGMGGAKTQHDNENNDSDFEWQ